MGLDNVVIEISESGNMCKKVCLRLNGGLPLVRRILVYVF